MAGNGCYADGFGACVLKTLYQSKKYSGLFVWRVIGYILYQVT
jgi:hypothetical protein